jgi:hypothetical protein
MKKKPIKGILHIVLAIALFTVMLLPAYAADISVAEAKAHALKKLGLFKGVSDTDFDLDRAPTRVEAMVMMIRTLGREAEALEMGGKHPFTDVPAWADKYIGYAYEKGLTKGVSATSFGTGNAGSDMYLTFVLRALGYNDSAGDFSWDAPDLLAKAVGILPDDVDTVNFLRSDVVLVSWASLEARLKGSSLSLAFKLIEEGVFKKEDYGKTFDYVNESKPEIFTAHNYEAFTHALSDSKYKVIEIDPGEEPMIVTGDHTIPEDVTVVVIYGNDFFIEGTLVNNGTIQVMGADSFTDDFINYSVMSVQNGGKVINNGNLRLCAASIRDNIDRGPVGGQLRIFDGSFENKGSVFLEKGMVNTHGGMAVIVGGTFTNDSLVVMDGFFLRVDEGDFTNNKGAVIINNSHIYAEEKGKFTNNGTINGAGVNEDSKIIEFNDEILEAKIRLAMNKPEGEITVEEAAEITSLDLSNESFDDMNSLNGGIRNIGALQYFINLKELNLSFNSISDFSPLAGLTKLEVLGFAGVRVKDLSPLKNLTNMTNLAFSWNYAPDQGFDGYENLDFMSDMKNLEIFEARGVGLKDISAITNLTKLWSVYLSDNQISDISPLANLTNLRELCLSNNPITDYSPIKDIYEQLEGKDFEIK